MGKKKDPNEPYETVEPNPEFRKEVFGKNNTATKADKAKLGKFKPLIFLKKTSSNSLFIFNAIKRLERSQYK